MTFIVDGYLTHKDSMGTEETLGRGSVQFMTAGTGIYHSEHNLSKELDGFLHGGHVAIRLGFRLCKVASRWRLFWGLADPNQIHGNQGHHLGGSRII